MDFGSFLDRGSLGTVSDDIWKIFSDYYFRACFEFPKCRITPTNHNYTLNTMSPKCNPFNYVFSMHMVPKWNGLLRSVIEAKIFTQFKN